MSELSEDHSLSNEEAISENLESWRFFAHVHARGDGKEFYRIDELIAGACSLPPWEVEEFGDVSGKTLLHLQCHIGTDTLSWARRGAQVTGLDFAPEAIEEANLLAQMMGIEDARFVCGRVEQADEVLGGEQFDIVTTGRGALCWLPDLDAWARACSAVTAPGGRLHLEEATPSLMMLDLKDGALTPHFDQFGHRRSSETSTGSYAAPEHPETRRTHCWEYRYDLIINALVNHGFVIERLTEREELPWTPWPDVFEPSRPGFWKLKAGFPRIPLSFTLIAKKSQ